MKIEPREGILLISKNEKAALKHDMVIEEGLDDKSLVVGTVISEGNVKFNQGTVVVFGRYSMFKLTYSGDDFFFLPEEDIIAIIEENV